MRTPFFAITAIPLLFGCGSASPPPSQFPDAKSAVARLDDTFKGVSGVKGTAKIDYLGDKGRVRGDLQVLAAAPASLRFAITANVIGGAGEVASDGFKFEAEDKGANKYLVGEPKPCNIARITQVPLPSDELVPTLWGMRPKIAGPIQCDSIGWSGDGFYRVTLSDASGLSHELHLVPTPGDWSKPWQEQHVRLVGVVGWSSNKPDADLVYRVTMKDHDVAHTAKPIVAEDPGLDEDVPPSGPNVDVEVPRTIHVEVPAKKADVIFQYTGEVVVNPPIPKGAFQLVLTPGVPVERAICD